jgi:hypothetical protein
MAYLYKHIRLDTNEVFYIGIGSDDLYKRANSLQSRNKHWKNIVNSTEYRVDIIEDGLLWEDACKREQELIIHYGRRDLGTGTLVNLTAGGEGLYNPARETRQKLSESHKGRIPWNKGLKGVYHHSDATREKLKCKRPGVSEKLKGRKQTADVIQNRVQKNTGQKRSTETKLKISKATLGKPKNKKK